MPSRMARASRSTRGPSRSRKNMDNTAKNSFAALRPTPPISRETSTEDCSISSTNWPRIAAGSAEICSRTCCAHTPTQGRSRSAGGRVGREARKSCTRAYAAAASTCSIKASQTIGTMIARVTSSVVSSAATPGRPRARRRKRIFSGQLTYARMPPQMSGTMNGCTTEKVSSTTPRIRAATSSRLNQGAVGRSASMGNRLQAPPKHVRRSRGDGGKEVSIPLRALCVELSGKRIEAALFDRRTHRLHQGQVLMEIMNGAEARGQNLAALVQMTQVRPAVMSASVAVALLVYGAHVGLVLRVADLDSAPVGKEPAIAGVAGGHYAVEHVHAAAHRFDEIFGRAHAHQIARPILRQVRLQRFEHMLAFAPRLADGEPADRVAVESDLRQARDRLLAQMRV